MSTNKTSAEHLADIITRATYRANELTGKVDKISSEIIVLKERHITDKELDQRVWQIWSDVKDNRDSLDLEKHCKNIRAVLDEAVASIQQRCEEAAVAAKKQASQNRKQASELSAANKEITALKKQKEDIEEAVVAANKKSGRFQNKVEELTVKLKVEKQKAAALAVGTTKS